MIDKLNDFEAHLHKLAEEMFEEGSPVIMLTIKVGDKEISYPHTFDSYESLLEMINQEKEFLK